MKTAGQGQTTLWIQKFWALSLETHPWCHITFRLFDPFTSVLAPLSMTQHYIVMWISLHIALYFALSFVRVKSWLKPSAHMCGMRFLSKTDSSCIFSLMELGATSRLLVKCAMAHLLVTWAFITVGNNWDLECGMDLPGVNNALWLWARELAVDITKALTSTPTILTQALGKKVIIFYSTQFTALCNQSNLIYIALVHNKAILTCRQQ